jgi:DNA invertase Pin-like site-specific DNA recombinase
VYSAVVADHPLTRPVRAVIYARVSADPTRELRSVDGQITECLAWIEQRDGWTLCREPFKDRQGASRHSRGGDRPGYVDLVAWLRAGRADALVLWEASRAQRDLADYLRLRDLCAGAGVLYVYNGRVFDLRRTDDRFTTGLDALLAEREVDLLRDRVNRGVRQHAESGRPYGRLMYGYRREYNERGAFVRQLPDPGQAAVVAELARRVDAGEPLAMIAADLNQRGVPTPDGAALWRGPRIREIVLRPAYRGARVWRGRVVREGCWPAIIDPVLQRRLAARLTDPGRRTQRGTALRWQLVGAGRCAGCGLLLISHSSGGQTRRRVYACPGCWVSIHAGHLDAWLNTLVVARLLRDDAADLFTPAADDAELAAADAAEADLRAQLADWRASAHDGRGTTPESLAAVEAGLGPQIEAAAATVRRLSRPAPLRDLDPVQLAADWPDRPATVRRAVIAALADVRLSRRRTGVPGFDPWRLAESRWRGDELTWGEHWAAEGITP